jgi:hypothetical protein
MTCTRWNAGAAGCTGAAAPDTDDEGNAYIAVNGQEDH